MPWFGLRNSITNAPLPVKETRQVAEVHSITRSHTISIPRGEQA
jgi:hypothetical protein